MPVILTGFLKQLFTQFFVDPRNIVNAKVREIMTRSDGWRPDEQTAILVESSGRWRPELTEKRPGVIIRREDWNHQSIAIGDKLHGLNTDATESRIDHWIGGYTVFALAGAQVEAENLASEILRVLRGYARLITEQLNVHLFRVTKIGAPGQLEEAKSNWAVPITIAVIVETQWLVREHAPILKRIEFRASDLIDG